MITCRSRHLFPQPQEGWKSLRIISHISLTLFWYFAHICSLLMFILYLVVKMHDIRKSSKTTQNNFPDNLFTISWYFVHYFQLLVTRKVITWEKQWVGFSHWAGPAGCFLRPAGSSSFHFSIYWFHLQFSKLIFRV